MKMKERCPVQFPCRNHWVLTCFTLVSLIVTTTLGQEFSEIEPVEDLSASARQSGPLTNGSSTQPPPVLPGKLTPINFSSSSQTANPPTTATFEMECTSPKGDVWDLCWLDNNTMIWVHGNNEKVLKVSVNRQNKSCSYIELKSPTNPWRVTCSPETGEIYVTDYSEGSVRVYDRNNLKAVWKPEGLVGKPYVVAMNRERIVVGPFTAGYLYVYDRNREYIGQVSIFQNKHRFAYTELTEKGLFVASTGSGTDRLIIHDLHTGVTVTTGGEGSENGQFDDPWGVSIVGDYILVSDHNNDRVPVFATNAGFHGNLQFKGANLQRPFAQAYRSETKLLAIKIGIAPHNNVKIFSLT